MPDGGDNFFLSCDMFTIFDQQAKQQKNLSFNGYFAAVRMPQFGFHLVELKIAKTVDHDSF